MNETAHLFADRLARLIELGGVGIILIAVLLATALFLVQGAKSRDWRTGYERYRQSRARDPARPGTAGTSPTSSPPNGTADFSERQLASRHCGDPHIPELLARDRNRGLLARGSYSSAICFNKLRESGWRVGSAANDRGSSARRCQCSLR